ncbi:MAG: glycoside hydrolase family 127 protein, partial [Thermomicrobiales bacterium]
MASSINKASISSGTRDSAQEATSPAVVVETSHSPFARHRSVPIGNVRLTDDFLAPRLRTNREITIPSQFEHLVTTNRFRNFERVAGTFDGPFDGIYFNDSDVYKWMEAAASTLAAGDEGSDISDDDLKNLLDLAIGHVESAQDTNGYLNSYFSVDRVDERWSNLLDKHELYCGGHMIQAAIAHYRATGSDRFLKVATRFADLVCEVFGPESVGKREQADGHEEIELALIELYRTTGEQKYLDQACFFIDVRGHGRVGGSAYHQDRVPVAEQSEMVGHAVRAVYLNAGATDLVAEQGDPQLRAALDRMWTNMTTRR